jgi:hypothetical protein
MLPSRLTSAAEKAASVPTPYPPATPYPPPTPDEKFDDSSDDADAP